MKQPQPTAINPASNSIKQELLVQQLKKQGKKTLLYQRLASRCYATPAGYASYSIVVERLASDFALMNLGTPDDYAASLSIAISAYLAEIQAPVYWLSQALADSLQHTTLPSWIGDMKRPIPGAILMLPPDLIQTPDGESVDHVAFVHCLRGETTIAQDGGCQLDHIYWTTRLPSSTVYSRDIPLKLNEEQSQDLFPRERLEYNVDQVDADAETAFTRTIDQLLVQTLLIMQLRPDLLEVGAEIKSSRGRGFSSVRSTETKFSPNWIGKSYQTPIVEEPQREDAVARDTTETGISRTHASPRSHWRRGHLRRVLVGPREQGQREWRWIEAVLVNPGLTATADTEGRG